MSIEWEPTAEGATLSIFGWSVALTVDQTKELMEDMEEAYMLARGLEKMRIPIEEVVPHDKVYVTGHVLDVQNVLADRIGTILQTHEEEEIRVLPGKKVTVWRRIE